MRLNLTAAVWKEDDWFVARCVEIEVASQGRSESEALKNLEEAILLYLEDEETGAVREPVQLRKVMPLTVSA